VKACRSSSCRSVDRSRCSPNIATPGGDTANLRMPVASPLFDYAWLRETDAVQIRAGARLMGATGAPRVIATWMRRRRPGLLLRPIFASNSPCPFADERLERLSAFAPPSFSIVSVTAKRARLRIEAGGAGAPSRARKERCSTAWGINKNLAPARRCAHWFVGNFLVAHVLAEHSSERCDDFLQRNGGFRLAE